MVNKADILKAISDLDSQETPHYAQIVKKYNLNRTTLMHCYKHETVSYYKACSIHQKLLTDA